MTKRDWNSYYNAIENRPPRKTLKSAIAAFKQTGFAIDLGCGTGRDTEELLRQNWSVLAIDQETEAIQRLQAKFENDPQLTTQVSSFEEFNFPQSVDLINASFSLPFCSPVAFSRVWEHIFNSLKKGGIFCGHLFGDRDSWCNKDFLYCQSRSQVETLLKPYQIELLEEEEHRGQTPLGEPRDWHIFHIVAKKNE